MRPVSYLCALFRRLQWRRGLRAALAVAAALLLCRAFGQPSGWAALGGFEAILVDNGGSYRSRFDTILTVLIGGALAGLLGAWVGRLVFVDAEAARGPGLVLFASSASAAICFAFTFARVLTRPLASTGVIILVIFFSGVGSGAYHLAEAAANVRAFVAGGLGAAVLSLFLWPLDPFRPARENVAAVYALLADATAAAVASASLPDRHHREHNWKRRLRSLVEEARTALTQTAARAPARTRRARNLTVLLETADGLFERALRLSELAAWAGESEGAALQGTAQWIARGENALARSLRRRPSDLGVSFVAGGSFRRQFLEPPGAPAVSNARNGGLVPHLLAEQQAAREEIAVAFDAVHALWTGGEAGGVFEDAATAPTARPALDLLEKLRAESSGRSTMFRHAWRAAAVGAVDVLLLWTLHLPRGAWLGLTSIIVLQPTGSGTWRRAWQRVAGTVAGGVFAAALAASTPNQTALLAVIVGCAGLTLACFAVDYGLYSFFLTPTFVLLSLPRPGDWHYAGVRVELTVLGAAVALLVMRWCWPEREHRELGRLLRTGAGTIAAYHRAVLRFWEEPTPERRRLLARARRDCGLASNAAEEALDRLLLQPSFGRQPDPELSQALRFTTSLRRLTQSMTTLASLGQPPPGPAAVNPARLEACAARLDALHLASPRSGSGLPPGDVRREVNPEAAGDVGEWQMRRMEHQIAVLESAAVF